MTKLHRNVKEIMDTREGQERNMYPRVKAIFEILGHRSRNILVDTGSELSRGIPDLIIQAPVGRGTKGQELYGDWLVCEVKDERNAFRTEASRRRIFEEKSKYITIDTSFFVMIDPERMVIRPVVPHARSNFEANHDTVITWGEVLKQDERWFLEQCSAILAESSGIGSSLQRFRQGDVSAIATVSLSPSDEHKREKQRADRAKKDFLHSIKRATKLLQSATKEALVSAESEIKKFESVLEEFSRKYDGIRIFNIDPFELRGENVHAGNAYEHDRDVDRIRDIFLANRSLAKLAFEWLPEFRKRIGKHEKDIKIADEMFAIETANMILARILLLRFFEDHGFFGEKRYICNGGVAAFQNMKDYFGLSYTKLLKDVYEKARHIYYAVFEEMELDWILGMDNEALSTAIEISLMHFSRYDFKSVKGDILTGIYDRFLEGSQRKKMGEYYTKPSIARYIVDRIQIAKGDMVIDPACGSGTFLLEVFDKTIGQYIEANLVDYDEAIEELGHIRGNDLNPFSSTIAQIQFLWHLLPFREQILEQGFPPISIAEKHNSLIPANLMGHDGSLYGRIDKKEYDAVIGNPPYVRPERGEDLPLEAQRFYQEDIKPDKNLFTLFIYRSLRSWCKAGGHLGFVIPLSFCDNNSNSRLRRLFQVGGKWKIVEIVDMEAISENVFDAAVQPIVLIAKNEPAAEADEVVIRQAGPECIAPETGEIRLENSRASTFPYSEIWSEDGRILTKIDKASRKIVDKLTSHQTFENIAFPIWAKKEKARIVQWSAVPPEDEESAAEWVLIPSIRRGAVFRNKKPKVQNGFDVYKGENISAGMIEGDPAEKNIDITGVSDPSLWRFLDVLPDRGFAFMRISSNLTATSFDPHRVSFLDTATLFFPKRELSNFPFDLLVLSNIYQFFYGIYARMGAVEKYYSNLYPTNIRFLPWIDALAQYSEKIESLREEYLSTCKAIYNREQTLLAAIEEVGAVAFRDLCLQYGAGREGWNLEIHNLEGNDTLEVFAPGNRVRYVEVENGYRIYPGGLLYSWVEVGNEFVAKSLSTALTIYYESALSKADLLRMPVPKDQASLKKFIGIVNSYDAGGAYGKLEEIIDTIDRFVADAFSIEDGELAYIQNEMKENPFLRKLKPKLPYSGRKKKGLLEGLASSERYK